MENKLFEAFVQAAPSARSSYAGTGLGMSIVKQLIEKMGGTIEAKCTHLYKAYIKSSHIGTVSKSKKFYVFETVPIAYTKWIWYHIIDFKKPKNFDSNSK